MTAVILTPEEKSVEIFLKKLRHDKQSSVLQKVQTNLGSQSP